MCGRFTNMLPSEVLAEIFGVSELLSIEARYNIAPTQEVVVIRQNAVGVRQLVTMKWGLIPSWAKDSHIGSKMINARCETVQEKPAFRQAIRTRRCIIPASGFYDWTHTDKKRPFYVSMADGAPMAFAGIWDSWKAPDESWLESFTILTTNANSLIGPIHDRMPVILHPAQFDLWLDRDITEPEKLTHLYHPYPSDLLKAWPVSSLVNSPCNDTPSCIEKVISNRCREEDFIFFKVATLVSIGKGESPTRTYIGSDDRVTLWEGGRCVSYHLKNPTIDVDAMLEAVPLGKKDNSCCKFEHPTLIAGGAGDGSDRATRTARTHHDTQPGYATLVKGGIMIHHHRSNPCLDLEQVFRTVKRAQAKILESFRYNLDCAEIFIYDSRKELQAHLQEFQEFSASIGGYCNGKIGVVLDSEESDPRELYVRLTHELVHLAIDDISKGRCPTWLNEGVAVYLSQDLNDTYVRRLAMAARAGAFLPFHKITSRKAAERQLVYAQCVTMVAFLAESRGWETVRKLVAGSSQRPFADMLDDMGLGGAELAVGWQEWLKIFFQNRVG